MSSWGKYDNAANSPLWGTFTVNKSPTNTNRNNLFDNTTQDYWKTATAGGGYRNENIAVGVFGVDAQEVAVDKKGAHVGWVRRSVGSGGRAGRVQEEVLVAMNTITSDSDAQTYANVTITLTLSTTAPSVTSNTSYANTATVVITPTLVGNTAATLTYQWQVNSGGSWTNAVDGTPANTNYSGATTATFGIKPADTTANGYKYRVIVTAADQGVTATSANVTMSVPA